jgi:hypothetical protein
MADRGFMKGDPVFTIRRLRPLAILTGDKLEFVGAFG